MNRDNDVKQSLIKHINNMKFTYGPEYYTTKFDPPDSSIQAVLEEAGTFKKLKNKLMKEIRSLSSSFTKDQLKNLTQNLRTHIRIYEIAEPSKCEQLINNLINLGDYAEKAQSRVPYKAMIAGVIFDYIKEKKHIISGPGEHQEVINYKEFAKHPEIGKSYKKYIFDYVLNQDDAEIIKMLGNHDSTLEHLSTTTRGSSETSKTIRYQLPLHKLLWTPSSTLGLGLSKTNPKTQLARLDLRNLTIPLSSCVSNKHSVKKKLEHIKPIYDLVVNKGFDIRDAFSIKNDKKSDLFELLITGVITQPDMLKKSSKSKESAVNELTSKKMYIELLRRAASQIESTDKEKVENVNKMIKFMKDEKIVDKFKPPTYFFGFETSGDPRRHEYFMLKIQSAMMMIVSITQNPRMNDAEKVKQFSETVDGIMQLIKNAHKFEVPMITVNGKQTSLEDLLTENKNLMNPQEYETYCKGLKSESRIKLHHATIEVDEIRERLKEEPSSTSGPEIRK